MYIIVLNFIMMIILNKKNNVPVQEILVLTAYASREGGDVPGHLGSPTGAFTAHTSKVGLKIKAQAKIHTSSPTRCVSIHIHKMTTYNFGLHLAGNLRDQNLVYHN